MTTFTLVLIGISTVIVVLTAAWQLFNWREDVSVRDGRSYLNAHKITSRDHNPWQYYDPDPSAGPSSGKDTRPFLPGYEPAEED